MCVEDFNLSTALYDDLTFNRGHLKSYEGSSYVCSEHQHAF